METIKEGIKQNKELLSEIKFRGQQSPTTEIKELGNDENLIHLKKFESKAGLLKHPPGINSPIKSQRANSNEI